MLSMLSWFAAAKKKKLSVVVKIIGRVNFYVSNSKWNFELSTFIGNPIRLMETGTRNINWNTTQSAYCDIDVYTDLIFKTSLADFIILSIFQRNTALCTTLCGVNTTNIVNDHARFIRFLKRRLLILNNRLDYIYIFYIFFYAMSIWLHCVMIIKRLCVMQLILIIRIFQLPAVCIYFI